MKRDRVCGRSSAQTNVANRKFRLVDYQKYRLINNKFGVVLASCRRTTYPSFLLKSLVEGCVLRGVQWVKENAKYTLN